MSIRPFLSQSGFRWSNRLNLLLLVWLVTVVGYVAILLSALPAYVSDPTHPSPDVVEALKAAYIPATAHATYHALLDATFAAGSIAVGGLILRRHRFEPLAVLSAFTVAVWGVGNGFVVEAFTHLATWRWTAVLPAWGLWLGLLSMSLARRGKALTIRDRQRLKWTLYGIMASASVVVAVTAAVGTGVTLAPEQVDRHMTGHLLVCLGGALFPLCLSTAWLKASIPDPDTLIRRTFVFAGLSAVIVAGSILLVILPALLYPALGPVYALALVTVWAICGLQLQRYLQQVVNRVLYGHRDEPMAVLNDLGSRLELGSPEHALATIAETVATALKLPSARIEVSGTDGLRELNATNDGELAFTAIPVRHEGVEVGRLIVAQRARDELLDERDREVLRFIARQAGPTVRAVQLNQELRRSRHEILVSREQERRRIRRDLHDGLGPALAAIAMQADTAREILDKNPEGAKELLEALTKQSEDIVQEVRRLVYELVPPALEELGLGGALERLARQHSSAQLQVEVYLTDLLPPLDAATEVGVYRVVSEALTNVVRHSGATSCWIGVESQTADGVHQLAVTIRDNGTGIPDVVASGIGLQSMRERASEVAATLSIVRHPDGGTEVKMQMPLRPFDGSSAEQLR